MGEITNMKGRLSLVNVAFFSGLHLVALLGFLPEFFSWSAVAVMMFFYWLTASIGICLGFHRYLTHRSLEVPKWVGRMLAFIGTLACQNGPTKWVAQHRMHHANSDQPLDPHTPNRGFFWAHMGWMLHLGHYDDKQKIADYSKDLALDPFNKFLDDNFIKIQVALGIVLFLIGGAPWLIWGVFVRLVVAYHSTWFVNSASHIWGYKNVKMKDDLATNCWWVGLLAWGEGWHNNHHAFPSSARHGLRWWEIDCTWYAITVLKWLGLAKNIKVVQLIPEEEESEKGYFSGEIVKQAA